MGKASSEKIGKVKMHNKETCIICNSMIFENEIRFVSIYGTVCLNCSRKYNNAFEIMSYIKEKNKKPKFFK